MAHFNFMIKKINILVAFLFFSCSGLLAQNNLSKVQELYDKGYYYYYYNNYEKAVDFFGKALNLEQNHYNSNLYNGLSLARLGRYKESLQYINHAFQLDSTKNKPEIYGFLAGIYFDLSDFEKSVFYYSKKIAITPKASSYLRRGQAQARLGLFLKAIEDFDHAVELGEESIEVYFERGTVNYLLGKYDVAVTDLLKVRQNINNDYVQVDYYLGEIFFTLQYFGKSVSYFSSFIDNKSEDSLKNLNALFKIGVCNYYLGKYTEALSYFDEISKIDSDYIGAAIYKGMTYMALKENEKSKTILENVLKKDPQNCLANHQMGILEYQNRNSEKGIEYFKVAKQMAFKTNDDFTLFGLAESYLNIQDTINSLDCLNKVIALNPNHYKAIEARISLNSHFLAQKDREVLKDFDLLFDIFKQNKQITSYFMARKSILLFELGEYDKSFAELENAIQLHYYFEYYAIRALLVTYRELKISQETNRNSIPSISQKQILQDADRVLQSNLRMKDAYLLKTTILLAFARNKEACITADEAIKLGAVINKDHLKFICKGKKPKEKNNEWNFFYNLSSFDERFSE